MHFPSNSPAERFGEVSIGTQHQQQFLGLLVSGRHNQDGREWCLRTSWTSSMPSPSGSPGPAGHRVAHDAPYCNFVQGNGSLDVKPSTDSDDCIMARISGRLPRPARAGLMADHSRLLRVGQHQECKTVAPARPASEIQASAVPCRNGPLLRAQTGPTLARVVIAESRARRWFGASLRGSFHTIFDRQRCMCPLRAAHSVQRLDCI